MPEAEQLSDLVGAIYDASLNPELWLPVLEQTSRFINSATATIGSRDMVQKHTSFSKAWGHDPHYLQLLESHYLKINPLNEGAALTRVGDVLSIGEVISATRALRSRSRLVRASATWPNAAAHIGKAEAGGHCVCLRGGGARAQGGFGRTFPDRGAGQRPTSLLRRSCACCSRLSRLAESRKLPRCSEYRRQQ